MSSKKPTTTPPHPLETPAVASPTIVTLRGKLESMPQATTADMKTIVSSQPSTAPSTNKPQSPVSEQAIHEVQDTDSVPASSASSESLLPSILSKPRAAPLSTQPSVPQPESQAQVLPASSAEKPNITSEAKDRSSDAGPTMVGPPPEQAEQSEESVQVSLPSMRALPTGKVQGTAGDPLVGEIIAERFRLQALLGKGGMGKVYLAEQIGLRRSVALKFLHANLSKDREKNVRFHREAQAMARLSHPNVVGVYDFGEWRGQLFLAMEFLEGCSLRELLVKHKGRMENEEIQELLLQTSLALDTAHCAGVVHRDLKPENIMVQTMADGSYQVKVVDFGLAAISDASTNSDESKLTLDGMTVGTPAYMSPEQVQGLELDGRSDIYALGVILYEMLCGKRPFGGSNWTIMMQHMYAEPKSPAKRIKADHPLQPQMEALALWSMEKAPEARPASARIFREKLEKAFVQSTESSSGSSTIVFGDRHSRANALGMPQFSSSSTKAADVSEVCVIVLEHTSHFMESLTALLRSNEFVVRPVETLEEALVEIQDQSEYDESLMMVMDIRDNPMLTLTNLQAQRDAGLLSIPIVVVGPDDAIEPMNFALEHQINDYIPNQFTSRKLPRALRKILRRQQRQSTPAP